MTSGLEDPLEIGFTEPELLFFAKRAFIYYKLSVSGLQNTVIPVFAFLVLTGIVALFQDPDANLVNILIAGVMIVGQVTFVGLFAFQWFCLYLLIIWYPRIRFKSLTATLEKMQLKSNPLLNRWFLDRFVRQFDELCVFLSRLNDLAKYMMFLVYILYTPINCLLCYLTIWGDIALLVRLVALLLFAESVVLLGIFNNQTAKISKEV